MPATVGCHLMAATWTWAAEEQPTGMERLPWRERDATGWGIILMNLFRSLSLGQVASAHIYKSSNGRHCKGAVIRGIGGLKPPFEGYSLANVVLQQPKCAAAFLVLHSGLYVVETRLLALGSWLFWPPSWPSFFCSWLIFFGCEISVIGLGIALGAPKGFGRNELAFGAP